MQKIEFNILLFLFFFLIQNPANARIVLPALFTDNMVLQQQTDAPLWGTADPGKEVTVKTSWDKKIYRTTSDPDGNWKVNIQTIQAGGPYEISISDGKEVKLKNILLGEVWLCSGQSNMEMAISAEGGIKNFRQEIETAEYPQIRLFTVGKDMANNPKADLKDNGGGWKVCSPETVGDFSAVGYFFGRNLHESLDVPIGLINASWGGTPVETWTSSEALINIPHYTDEIQNIRQYDDEGQVPFFEKRKQEWEELVMLQDPGYENNLPVATGVEYKDEHWKTMNLPSAWEDQGLPDLDGIVWFRKSIVLPDEWENKELVLSLSSIDDNDITFFNGTEIGRTEGYYIERKYTIPASLVKKGKAVIAVRVDDKSGGGGLSGKRENMFLAVAGNEEVQRYSINGNWKYVVALDWNRFPQAPRYPVGNPNRPSVLFNAMIHPLIPFAIQGCIWYQGEENTRAAYPYRSLFPNMIMDWRNRWNKNLPFYFVQLANYMQRDSQPGESAWAELRDAQKEALHLENTGMAVIIDAGEAYDIHPKNKQDVGLRLSLAARAKTYGEDIVYSGPVYKDYFIEGNKIRLTFEHVAQGLRTSDNQPVKGFAIAGADKKFYWANAEIKGNEIIVSSPDVKYPVAVRYAWANNPECNVCNSAGLPASPFRTDY